jgi:hypothetical protein
MITKKKTSNLCELFIRFRVFLAGTMAVYALSGIILIFRDTDF